MSGWDDVNSKACKGTCGWKDALEDLGFLLDDSQYSFAWSFLSDLETWIKKHKHVTQAQLQSIENVKNAEPRDDGDKYGLNLWDLKD